MRNASSTDDYFTNKSSVLSKAGRAKGLKPGRKSIKLIEMIEFSNSAANTKRNY